MYSLQIPQIKAVPSHPMTAGQPLFVYRCKCLPEPASLQIADQIQIVDSDSCEIVDPILEWFD